MVVTLARHTQANPPVVEQDLGSRHQRPDQFGMRKLDPRRVARLGVGVQPEGLAGLKPDDAGGEAPDAQLWPLQVGNDCDRLAVLLSTWRIAATLSRCSSCVP